MPQRLLAGEPDHPSHLGLDDIGRAESLMSGIGGPEDVLRCFAHHPGRSAVLVLDDLTALGRLGVLVQFDETHRELVHEYAVAAGVDQHHRMIGRRRAERVVHRHAFDQHLFAYRPFVLMPAATDDPFAGRHLCGRLGHHGNDLGEALRVAEIEDQQRITEARVMTVPLDQSGDQHLPVEVDHLGVFTLEFEHLLGSADGEDAVAFDRDGLGCRLRFVDGYDVGIDQEEVSDGAGVLRFVPAAACEEGGREDELDGQSGHCSILTAFGLFSAAVPPDGGMWCQIDSRTPISAVASSLVAKSSRFWTCWFGSNPLSSSPACFSSSTY